MNIIDFGCITGDCLKNFENFFKSFSYKKKLFVRTKKSFIQRMSSSSSKTTSNIKTEIDDLLKTHPIVLFYRSHCPFSQRALRHLVSKRVVFQGCDLQQLLDDKPAEYRTGILYLQTKYKGVSTVPQLYINGQYKGDSQTILSTY